MTDFSFDIKPTGSPGDVFVTFTHSHDGFIFFIGYAPIDRFMSEPNLRLHSAWQTYVKTVNPPSVKVDAWIHQSARLAFLHASELQQKYKLPIEMYCNPFANHYRYGLIKCEETDRFFKTGAEAARWIGCSPAQMSCHLARKSGYRTIKGYTFTKVMQREKDENV